ncbi:MAG: hypothetical protein IPH00_17395 [Flavobacteriales bacterium]|nr:hypothetical protein [Flavobacteriales bacterium]
MQFNKIIGHAELKARLIGNIREGRVAHAQFYLGPRGSGVLPLVLAYATYLFCEDPGAGDSCGQCNSCKMMEKVAHPDLNLVFPIFLSDKGKTCEPFAGEWRDAVLKDPYLDADVWREVLKGENKQLRMGVDIAAEVVRKLSLKSYMGGWKVMLIWLSGDDGRPDGEQDLESAGGAGAEDGLPAGKPMPTTGSCPPSSAARNW